MLFILLYDAHFAPLLIRTVSSRRYTVGLISRDVEWISESLRFTLQRASRRWHSNA